MLIFSFENNSSVFNQSALPLKNHFYSLALSSFFHLMHHKVTVKSPINIALVKYWGKEDEELIIPCNSSISITLDTKTIFTETTVTLGTSSADSFILNGQTEKISSRMQQSIQAMKKLLPLNSPYLTLSMEIQSKNNFPTAAGMASSASGISALVFALWKLFELENSISQTHLTTIARIGSGSACRSIPGGFVLWEKGSVDCPSDSIAKSIASPVDNLRILIYVFSTSTKSTSSSIGMSVTKKTSTLFPFRISSIVPERLSQMNQAIQTKNWPMVFELTIKDSNSFHACCLDSFPPIVYLSEKSLQLINLVCQFNQMQGSCLVGYSFDAGANGFVFMTEETMFEWKSFVGTQLTEPVECQMGNGTELVSIE